MRLKHILMYNIEQVLEICLRLNEYRMDIQKDINDIEMGKNDLLAGINYDTRQSLQLDNVPQRHIIKDPTIKQILINLENYEKSIERLRDELNEVFIIENYYRKAQKTLKRKEHIILERFYRNGDMIKTIATDFNISPTHCSRLHKRIIKKIRPILAPLMAYDNPRTRRKKRTADRVH